MLVSVAVDICHVTLDIYLELYGLARRFYNCRIFSADVDSAAVRYLSADAPDLCGLLAGEVSCRDRLRGFAFPDLARWPLVTRFALHEPGFSLPADRVSVLDCFFFVTVRSLLGRLLSTSSALWSTNRVTRCCATPNAMA